MDLTEKQIKEYSQRLMISRMRVLQNSGFFGSLLMHMKYGLDIECDTAYTDGNRIMFSPHFMDELNDKEIDFVLMHEIMHVVLKHCLRGEDKDNYLFNIACDIVVNSNILQANNMDISTISIGKYGPLMHIAPDKNEGYMYTAEEVYEMLTEDKQGDKSKKGNKQDEEEDDDSNISGSGNKKKKGANQTKSSKGKGSFDDHSKWGQINQNEKEDKEADIDSWIIDAYEVAKNRKDSLGVGKIPLFAERMVEEIKKGVVNWREILNNFICEEINDYSFSPPDRRFDDTGFFLPDFNDKEESVKNIWFVIDTSGSMSDKDITDAFSEIVNAIEQFNGKLEGTLSFME
ncbi:MAG: hypothetical protein K5765_01350, partial [Clostridia bacterium]|nr:hypothetical protein [Clostridia bacterium]